MTQSGASAHALTLSLSDLNTTINHEPRILDLVIARRLGMADPHDIRRLIEDSRAELELHGEIFRAAPGKTGRRGRPGKGEFWLNEGQALVVCMLSRTSSAAAVRHEVITVYMAHRRASAPSAAELSGIARDYAALPPRGLTAEQRAELTGVAASLGARAASWTRATLVEEVSRRVAAGTGYQRALAQVHAEMFLVMTGYPPGGDGLDPLRAVFREVLDAPDAETARRGRR